MGKKLFKKKSPYLKLAIILLGYILIGIFLNLYNAILLVWIFTILSILYLSWTGKGGVPVVIFIIFFIIFFSIYEHKLMGWSYQLAKNPSLSELRIYLRGTRFSLVMIIWILNFILIWTLSIALCLYHSFSRDFLYNYTEKKYLIFTTLSIIAFIGLKIGYILGK